MPGKTASGLSEGSRILCARCQDTLATVSVRAEQLCRDCFMNYVGSKVMKRMDGYKVRGLTKERPRKILLSLSLGVSSVTLLYLLDQQLRIQMERTSQVGYELHVLYVKDEEFVGPVNENVLKSIDLIKTRFPLHKYTTMTLDEVYRYPSSLGDEGSSTATTLIQPSISPTSSSPIECLRLSLALLPSLSARTDMIHILRTRLVVGFAIDAGCESIIWGDSTTRLAERILAETAKGRGFSIPWQTADGLSPHGINYIFPMRDMLRKEIIRYSSLTNPPLSEVVVEKLRSPSSSVSSKDVTIDQLMSQYFESVELNYPSIVANVVRTSGKLKPASTLSPSSLCCICSLPVANGTQGLHTWGGDQENTTEASSSTSAANATSEITCYGCSRSVERSTGPPRSEDRP
ncbi:cytoplasmic tRNA 2-thiolation protein 2 [Xylographa opegraphella]|nr:cytoplasmic tRNA 2-thiolation protein 2 [Xylographa opegraphella]